MADAPSSDVRPEGTDPGGGARRRSRRGRSPGGSRLARALGLYLLAPALLLLTLPVAVRIAEGPYLGLQVRQLVVVSVAPDGPAARAGVRAGDRLLSVDGRPLASMAGWYAALAAVPSASPGAPAMPPPLVLGLSRPAGRLLAPLLPAPPPRSRIVWGYGLWVAGLSFLLIGWWVLWRRNDAVTRTFFGLCLIFAFFLADVPDWPSPGVMAVKETLRDLLQLLWPALFLRFFLLFPAPAAPVLAAPRRPRHRLLLLPAVPLFLLTLWGQLSRLDPATSATVRVVQTGAFFYFVVYFVAGLWIFGRKVLRRDRPVQHTKLRLVLLGLVGGLAPFLLGMILGNVFPRAPIPHWEYLGFSLLLVPASFGLAILRYGALDTGYVVRSGLLWATLTVLVLAIYFLVVGLAGHLLTRLFGVSTYPLVLVAVAGGALLLLPARRAVQDWLDRTFYPERRATRAAIVGLGQELSGELDGAAAATTLLERLAELYQPARLSLFVRREGGADLAEEAALGADGPLPAVFSLPADGPLARFLDRARRPVFAEDFELALLEGLLPGAPAGATATAGGGEAGDDGGEEPTDAEASTRESTAPLLAEPAQAGFLERLGCELMVPLVTGGRLVGLLAFGPKRSGELYTQDDLANLRLLAVQAAALLESRRLYAQILQRRQLETELAVARDIQAQLLPTGPLRLAGIQIEGRTRSCREVGGDYFDYFPLDERTVGLAIADVAGKGIPAALMMSTLRVTFRDEACRQRRPERVVERLNRSLCELGGTLVAFFYGVYEPADRRLVYCNAGLEPPALLRPGRRWLEELSRGGPLLGVDPDRRYRAGTLALAPGDLLLCYTDGLTEQADDRGEFFGRDRLLAAAVSSRPLGVGELIERLLAVVDAHGPEQSDDRTLLALHVEREAMAAGATGPAGPAAGAVT